MRDLRILIRKSLQGSLHAGAIVRDQSPLKLVVISFFCVGWLVGFWYLFEAFFRFLHGLGGAGFMLIPKLFALFFMGLGFMLVLSGAITSYSAVYQSRETRALLTMPISTRSMLHYKFLESSLLSSWAFFFIIVPFIGGYATYRGLSLSIAVWTISFSVPFVMLCSGFGMLLIMILVRWMPGGRILVFICSALGLTILLRLTVFAMEIEANAFEGPLVLTNLIPGLKLSGSPLLPSWWMAEGVMSMTRNQWSRGFMLWGTLTSSLFVMAILVGVVGERIFDAGYQRVVVSHRVNNLNKPYMLAWLDRLLPFGVGDLRAFVMKDIRIFLRDPSQWSQCLIFFGLLGLYFVNIRNFGYDHLSAQWRNLIAFLNLFSLSAVMCSLAARFVYPQLSMEGQGIWKVGLAPTSLPRIMIVKFSMAFFSLLIVGETLTITSCIMLDSPSHIIYQTSAIVFAICASLSALATGLGAVFMDIEAKTPARIISGFGGTLNLVLGILGVLVMILPLAVTMHFDSSGAVPGDTTRRYMLLAFAWITLVTVVMTAVPLSLGRRALLSRDF
ncbi:MAG: ABC-2 type transport system permease protein [Kiritimatiellia bacterium]|jgi:ABC-2 type transport system permease protein